MWNPYVPYVCRCLQKTEDDIGVEDGVGAGSWAETLDEQKVLLFSELYI